MVPGESTALQDTAAINNGIMAQHNANHDYDGSDARIQDDKSEGTQGNPHAEDQDTGAMATTEPIHLGTTNEKAGRRQERA